MGRGRQRVLRIAISLGLVSAAIASPAAANWGADPATREWPSWPYETTCGSRQGFDPISVFSQPATAESQPTSASRALRRFLRDPVISWVPRHNYRLLREDRRSAEFLSSPLSNVPAEAPELLRFERRKGRWKWVGSGPCTPESIVAGRIAIPWDLAPDGPPLTPNTQVIEVRLGHGGCASGQSQNKRAHPAFYDSEGKLLLAIWLSPPKGGPFQTCVGIIEPPLKVRLPESLGERELFDSGTYPPHPATGAPRGF